MVSSINASEAQSPNVMSKIEAGMRRLIKRLPEWQVQIEGLVRKDDVFCEVCQDYEEVAQLIADWRQRASSYAAKRLAEYETLLQELEAEGLHYLRREEVA